MQHVYEPHAYSDTAIDIYLWCETPLPEAPPARGDLTREVAIISGGFTGLSAALHLARVGLGATRSNSALEHRFGARGRQAFHDAEREAVALVEDLTGDEEIDCHFEGETDPCSYAEAFKALPQRFPRGRHRRALLMAVNARLSLADR